MTTWKSLSVVLVVACLTSVAHGQPASGSARGEPAAAPAEATPRTAPSRVTAVTVYQGNALVTREVDVPEGKGLVEIVVTPLPAQTVDSSLYAEGTDGVPRPEHALPHPRRQGRHPQGSPSQGRADPHPQAGGRAAAEGGPGHRAEPPVAHQARELHRRDHAATGREGAPEQRGDPGAGQVRDETRAEKSAAQVALQQKLQANTEATEFATRELAELTSGSSRTERDAVIVVDKGGPAGKVRLNYLVTAATWRPQYRFRGGPRKTRSSSNTWRPSSSRPAKTGPAWT